MNLNPNQIKEFFQANTLGQKLFLIGCIAIIIFNINPFIKEINRIESLRRIQPYQIIGHKFWGLSEKLKDVHTIGYYTDGKPNDDAVTKEFAQAQYILAPIILDFNSLEHEYVLFVCRDNNEALKRMSEAGLKPYLGNGSGFILARRMP